MPEIEIRPAVSLFYEDHWFGNPWTAPETVVMVHGNAESSRIFEYSASAYLSEITAPFPPLKDTDG